MIGYWMALVLRARDTSPPARFHSYLVSTPALAAAGSQEWTPTARW